MARIRLESPARSYRSFQYSKPFIFLYITSLTKAEELPLSLANVMPINENNGDLAHQRSEHSPEPIPFPSEPHQFKQCPDSPCAVQNSLLSLPSDSRPARVYAFPHYHVSVEKASFSCVECYLPFHAEAGTHVTRNPSLHWKVINSSSVCRSPAYFQLLSGYNPMICPRLICAIDTGGLCGTGRRWKE